MKQRILICGLVAGLLLSMIGCSGKKAPASSSIDTNASFAESGDNSSEELDVSANQTDESVNETANNTSKNTTSTTKTPSSKAQTSAPNTIEIIKKYDSDNLPKTNLNGFTLRVGAHYTAQLNPGGVKKSSYKTELRNKKIQELEKRFNFKIEVEFLEANKSSETYAARIFSGDKTVPHIIMDTTWASGGMISAGLLTDFNTVKYIDMDAPWWNQSLRANSTINGKTYMMQSEISYITVDNIWMLAYNKRIAKEIGLTDDVLYKMVNNKKWTLDKMVYYASQAVKNMDSDPKMTSADRWGFTGAPADSFFALMNAGGTNFVNNNKGKMQYGLNNAASISLMKELNKVFTSYNIYDPSTTNAFETHYESFINGHALFYTYSATNLIRAIREMDDDAGLIPLPISGTMSSYRGRIDTNSSSIIIPKNVSSADLEKVGLILEALSFATWKETEELVDYYGENYLDSNSAKVLADAFSWGYTEPSNFIGVASFSSACKAPVAQAVLKANADMSGLVASIANPSQAALNDFFEQ